MIQENVWGVASVLAEDNSGYCSSPLYAVELRESGRWRVSGKPTTCTRTYTKAGQMLQLVCLVGVSNLQNLWR